MFHVKHKEYPGIIPGVFLLLKMCAEFCSDVVNSHFESVLRAEVGGLVKKHLKSVTGYSNFFNPRITFYYFSTGFIDKN